VALNSAVLVELLAYLQRRAMLLTSMSHG